MIRKHPIIFTSQLRPLPLVLATLFFASAVPLALPARPTPVPASPNASSIVITNCNDSGAGSLREAVNNAISEDTIDLTQLNCSTISLTTGSLVLRQDTLTLVGPGRNQLVIDGRDADAVLYHLGSGTLDVSAISIINGYIGRANADAGGACVHANSNLQLYRVNVDHCKTSAGANHNARGGAVYAKRLAFVYDSAISNGTATATDQGVAVGGGIYARGGLDMRGSTVTDSIASSHLPLKSFAGGVYASGSVYILGSTISANHADLFGGLDLEEGNGNLATISSSTVSGNSSIFVGGLYAAETLNLSNSTIAFNTSSEWTDSFGHYFAAGAHILIASQLNSTIISNNFNASAPTPTADLTGSADVTGGHNNVMFCDIACPAGTTNEDPGLHPLQDNGGPTRTHKPSPGLWHRLGGSNELHLEFDQRGSGFPRESTGDPIEIGAFQTNSDIIFVNGLN